MVPQRSEAMVAEITIWVTARFKDRIEGIREYPDGSQSMVVVRNGQITTESQRYRWVKDSKGLKHREWC
jgi:hypothetical protein